MKKFSFLLFCLSGLVLNAQEVSVVSSAEMDNRVLDSHDDRVLGSDASGNYVLRTRGPITNSETIVEQYTTDMKWVASITIPGSSGSINDGKFHRQTVLLNGKILTFHDRWSKADGASYFTVLPYEMSGDKLPEVELDKEPAAGLFKTPTFEIALSSDGSKLVVLDEVPFEKGTVEKMRIKVFSTSGFEVLWSRDLTMETESDRYPDNDIAVDNQGNAFVFKHVKLGTKDHLYQLIIANKAGVKTENVNLQTFFPTEFKMVWDTDGALVIAGMLSTHGQSSSNWERVWTLKANATGIVFNQITPIPQQLLRTKHSEKQALLPTARLNDFKLKAVLVRKSGGIMLLAEEYHATKAVIGTATPPTYEHSLEFGGIAVIATDAAGKELWSNYVSKKQNEKTLDEERYFGSFAAHTLNDKLYIVWNYTNWETLISVPYRFWTDKSGARINIDNLYGKKAVQPTLLTVLNPDGAFAYQERTFYSYPLADIQKPNAFEMAMDPHLFFGTGKGMIVMSRMSGVSYKKYKFGTMVF